MGFMDELNDHSSQIKEIELETFSHVYELCQEHIRTENKNGKKTTIYKIPGFILGRPVYSASKCLYYIRQRLEEQEIYSGVYSRHDNSIIISWKQKENKPRKSAPRPPSKPSNFDEDDIKLLTRIV
jgi:hypothetical protein